MPGLEPLVAVCRAMLYFMGNIAGGLGLVFLAGSFVDGRRAAQAIGFIAMAMVFDYASRAGQEKRR